MAAGLSYRSGAWRQTEVSARITDNGNKISDEIHGGRT